MKALDIIKNLVRLAGSVAGIILVSIGAVMMLNSFLKFYIFGIETGKYFNPNSIWQCERVNPDSTDFDTVAYQKESAALEADSVALSVVIEPQPWSPKLITPEERERLYAKYKLCVGKEIENEKSKYKKEKLEFLADGIAFLIVGLMVLFFYRNRKETK